MKQYADHAFALAMMTHHFVNVRIDDCFHKIKPVALCNTVHNVPMVHATLYIHQEQVQSNVNSSRFPNQAQAQTMHIIGIALGLLWVYNVPHVGL